MKKVFIIILLAILLPLLVIYIIMFVSFYVLPDPRAEQAYQRLQYYDQHKIIHFENKIDSADIVVRFMFRYSLDNKLDSLAFVQLGSDSLVLQSDTSYFQIYKSGEYTILPMLRGDSIAFPQSFSIGIYQMSEYRYRKDSLLKQLDYEAFKKYAIPKAKSNDDSFLSANEWTLTIDSTLVDMR